MELKEVYEGDFLQLAYEKLQSQMVAVAEQGIAGTDGNLRFIVSLQGPEVLPDEFLTDWIAYNYFFASLCDANGKPLLAEVDGIIKGQTGDLSNVVVGFNSLRMIRHSAHIMEETSQGFSTNPWATLEMMRVLKARGDAMVLNAKACTHNYSLATVINAQTLADLVIIGQTPSVYVISTPAGAKPLSISEYANDYYVFNIPYMPSILDKMSGKEERNITRLRNAFNPIRHQLIPGNHFVGFHFINETQDNVVTTYVRPLTTFSTCDLDGDYLNSLGLVAVKSKLGLVGHMNDEGKALVPREGILDRT